MFETLTSSPIFVGGVPRSGTTLLRVILDSHPRIFCGTELRVIHSLAALWASAEQTARPLLSTVYGIDAESLRNVFADLILSFLNPAWQASGKPRIAEKTPSNLLVFRELRAIFPESPLIHVIRDGRDVVASRLERDKAAAAGTPIDTVALARERAQEWVDAMAVRRKLIADPVMAGRYFELRYEDLVREPQATLTPLFTFLGEAFDPAVLAFHRIPRSVAGTEEWSAEAVRRPIFTSSAGSWQEKLSAREQSAVLDIARDALTNLGYTVAGEHGSS